MDNRILMAGAAVLVVGAAFGAGYYVNHPSAPPPAPAIPSALVPNQVAEQPVQTAPSAAAPVAEQAPAAAPVAQPVVKKRRLPDYASGETAYSAPPPPPPPPPRDFGSPNPFEEHFATFPMRHSGSGTMDAPLTWTAQTGIGHGHEADLRVSVVVPVPPPGDNGVFWSKWGSRRGDDVMPDVTRETPVVVAASASVVVAIDPQFLDLDAPAVLSVDGRDGQRIYRSRDVAPARGESWDAQGARWIFQPDADFFRLMRDGANVSISFRSRVSPNPVRVPFSTEDFPPSLNGFERDLYMKIPGIAAAWDRARPGAPPPPPPRQAYNPPPPNYPPQYGPQPQGGPQNGWQQGQQPPNERQHNWPSQNGWQQGQAPQQQGGAPQQPPAPANATLPAAPPTQTAQPSPQNGNGRDHDGGDHIHDHGPGNNVTAAAGPNPNPPPAAAPPANAPPAKPAPVQNPAAPPPPRMAAQNPGATMIAAEIAAYHPPTDDCGPQPPVPQQAGPSPERKQSNIWLKCRNQWMNEYKKSVNMLNRDASQQGTALEGVSGGSAIIANFEKAQGELNAQKASIKP